MLHIRHTSTLPSHKKAITSAHRESETNSRLRKCCQGRLARSIRKAIERDRRSLIELSASILLSAILYSVGVTRMPVRWRKVNTWYFAGGWVALVLALVSPIHAWGGVLFSAHMTQHEILMLVAAPLLVLGRPIVPFLWALPRATARSLGRLSFVTGPSPERLFVLRSRT